MSTICSSRVFCVAQELNAEPVIPEGFPEWEDVMNSWGHKMIAAVEVHVILYRLGIYWERQSFSASSSLGYRIRGCDV